MYHPNFHKSCQFENSLGLNSEFQPLWLLNESLSRASFTRPAQVQAIIHYSMHGEETQKVLSMVEEFLKVYGY